MPDISPFPGMLAHRAAHEAIHQALSASGHEHRTNALYEAVKPFLPSLSPVGGELDPRAEYARVVAWLEGHGAIITPGLEDAYVEDFHTAALDAAVPFREGDGDAREAHDRAYWNDAAIRAAADAVRREQRDRLNAAYDERNRLALGFAALASRLGWTVGRLDDPGRQGWPVLMIDTPAGQMGWHMRATEVPEWVPSFDGRWDGHTTGEKYERLAALPPARVQDTTARELEALAERIADAAYKRTGRSLDRPTLLAGLAASSLPVQDGEGRASEAEWQARWKSGAWFEIDESTVDSHLDAGYSVQRRDRAMTEWADVPAHREGGSDA